MCCLAKPNRSNLLQFVAHRGCRFFEVTSSGANEVSRGDLMEGLDERISV